MVQLPEQRSCLIRWYSISVIHNPGGHSETMSRFKICGVMILCLLMTLLVKAEAGSNGAWQLLQNGAVSVHIPADWQIQPGLPAASDSTGSTTVSINVI